MSSKQDGQKSANIFNININAMREKSHSQDQDQDLNQASTTISEETKKDEKKLKNEENSKNSAKTEINSSNDNKMQKQVENPFLNSNSINREYKDLCEQEKIFNFFVQRNLNFLNNPNNVNYYLLHGNSNK